MLESDIEKYLINAVKSIGGLVWKFVSPGTRGVPDRIVALPEGRTFYVELKKPGEKPKQLQLKRHKQLRDRGHQVYVIDSLTGVDDFLQEVTQNAG
ncbi:MAG: VRR-NUC domain-containing protein [Syntrophothermus sp.]|uniref:VRR-NUC domain-containing protein n=1 Tax=Syntrophothermus sp. TaxID=2736299 RepID=UPI0025811E11|nr:VRR-NUC domain-containing protein [Syntrophothermus sp.]NSW84445.1 VRR-NUC domain-containing protein [Syntrophothermus sp.]